MRRGSGARCPPPSRRGWRIRGAGADRAPLRRLPAGARPRHDCPREAGRDDRSAPPHSRPPVRRRPTSATSRGSRSLLAVPVGLRARARALPLPAACGAGRRGRRRARRCAARPRARPLPRGRGARLRLLGVVLWIPRPSDGVFCVVMAVAFATGRVPPARRAAADRRDPRGVRRRST